MKTLALVVRTAPLLLVMSGNIYAEEICDCSVKKGNCNATLSVKPTSQPNGIHGASVKVATDTASCARVDYYVEHTPTVTFLRHGGSVVESVTGSLRPMNPSMFTVDACRVCEVRKVQESSSASSLADSLFDSEISSGSEFNPESVSGHIEDLEREGNASTQAIQGLLNTAHQFSQQSQSQSQSQYKSGLLNFNKGTGYEYSDSSVKPLPPENIRTK